MHWHEQREKKAALAKKLCVMRMKFGRVEDRPSSGRSRSVSTSRVRKLSRRGSFEITTAYWERRSFLIVWVEEPHQVDSSGFRRQKCQS
uniref:Uncharacterized protein n=1 Tax=Heterorhabditis bacteriophora TaxID=37862 RepID=A0A1I7XBA2_HETBA